MCTFSRVIDHVKPPKNARIVKKKKKKKIILTKTIGPCAFLAWALMIDKENKKTLGKKTHEGKILIYCGGNILLLRRWCHTSCVATYSSSSGVGVTRLVLRRTPPPPALVSTALCCNVLVHLRRWCHATCVATYSSSSGVGVTRLVLRHTPPPALVSRDWCCDVPLLTRKK